MKKFLFIATAALSLAALASCNKEENKTPVPDPEITNESEIGEVPFTGGTVTYEFESNKAWSVTKYGADLTSSENYEVEISPISGEAGKNAINLTFPANKTADAIEFSFTITLQREEGEARPDDNPYTKEVKVTVAAPSVTDAAGNIYKVAYLKDGNYWMAENLRYIPDGQTVSDGTVKDASIWYPYTIEDKEAKVLKDEASIKKLGLLYSPALALGVSEINESNYNQLEKAQGLCPEGWHVPSRTELVGLCAATTKGDGETAAPAVNKDAVFYDAELDNATIAKANEAGFNFTFSGFTNKGVYSALVIDDTVCNVEEYYGNPRMSYYLGSTGYKSATSVQTFAMFSTFTKTLPYGKLSAGYNNLTNGVAVRCVMNSEK